MHDVLVHMAHQDHCQQQCSGAGSGSGGDAHAIIMNHDSHTFSIL